MWCIFGNYGNETIALIQWAYEQPLSSVYVVSIETAWAASGWEERVKAGRTLAEKYGFATVHLSAVTSFAQLMQQKRQFPTIKTQWCAGFLKGLTVLQWLDEVDPAGEMTLLLGHRQAGTETALAERIEASPHYGERKVWHPLVNADNSLYVQLLTRAGLPILNHRSLECDPCINNSTADFQRLQAADIEKTALLETTLHKVMFPILTEPSDIQTVIRDAQQQSVTEENSRQFSLGCGSPFACGL